MPEARHSDKVVQQTSRDVCKPIEEVWEAVTRRHQEWYFGSHFVTEQDDSAAFRYESPDGSVVYITGRIEQAEPPYRLVQQFAFADLDDAPTQVTWQLEPVAAGTRVQVTHVFAGMTKTYRRTKRGWPTLLANLDMLLTRGRLSWSTRLQNAMMAPTIRLVQRLKG